MRAIELFSEFKNYYKILMIGFIGGTISFIFSFTFESLLSQMTTLNNFFSSLFVALIWSFVLGFFSFLLLKLLGANFKK